MRHVVLYDTLINQLEVDQIMAVLCHEIGHWKRGHGLQMFLCTISTLLLVLFGFSYLMDSPRLYSDFGSQYTPYWLGFSFYLLLIEPLFVVYKALLCVLVRRNEFQADTFAHQQGWNRSLKSALFKISETNNVVLNPDSQYALFNHTHPTILDRIMALDRLWTELGSQKSLTQVNSEKSVNISRQSGLSLTGGLLIG